jgi:dihydrodipicolinate synthase/N-acetylneuraminate lyase
VSKPTLFQGVIVPTVTPLRDSTRIDTDAVGKIVDYLLANGVDGIFPLGTTGEAMSIGVPMRSEMVRATIKSVAGRVPVYAGISSNVMNESIDAAREYADLGADAVVAHVPTYYALEASEIESYFLKLADESPLPLVLYNIPATTHHMMSIESVVKLSKHANIRAIKDSAPDGKRAVQLIKSLGDFPMLLGSRVCFAEGLKAGAAGTVPAGAHLMPAEYCAMYDASVDKDWAEVDRLQAVTDQGMAAVLGTRGVGQSIAVIKDHLAARGLCSSQVMPPLCSVEALATQGGVRAQ